MGEQETTSGKGDVYVSYLPGAGIEVEAVVIVDGQQIDATAKQARDLFECLLDVLGVES